jgi:DNA-binding response OmpR family regulator
MNSDSAEPIDKNSSFPGPAPEVSEGCDVLIVEDDRVLSEQLADALREEGYTVATAPDGRAAIELVRKGRVGVMILDLMLPVMSGWEVLDAFKTSPDLVRMPTLIMTAVSNAHRAQGGPVFLKPLNLSSLLRAVRAYLGERA